MLNNYRVKALRKLMAQVGLSKLGIQQYGFLHSLHGHAAVF